MLGASQDRVSTVRLDRSIDAVEVSVLNDNVGRPARGAIGQNTNGYIVDTGIDERDRSDSLSCQATMAADIKANGAAVDGNILPVKPPVPYHLHRSDAVGEL
jgi:hypothetical protein